jgi:hypothetical protein
VEPTGQQEQGPPTADTDLRPQLAVSLRRGPEQPTPHQEGLTFGVQDQHAPGPMHRLSADRRWSSSCQSPGPAPQQADQQRAPDRPIRLLCVFGTSEKSMAGLRSRHLCPLDRHLQPADYQNHSEGGSEGQKTGMVGEEQ